MKLTQNQFYGLKYQMPREFTPGAQYITLDSKELFIYDETGLPVLVGGAQQTIIINNDPDAILEIGIISKVGTEITIPGGVKWRISGVIYNVATDSVFNINLSTAGFIRKDIVVADNFGIIYLIEGIEDETSAVRPNIPEDSILITEINVTSSDITNTNVLIGEDYVKKSFYKGYAYPESGSNIVLPLRPDGTSSYTSTGTGLTSVDGFDLSLITGITDAENPYDGKELLFFNNSLFPVTLNNNGSGEIPFIFRAGLDIEVPVGEVIALIYSSGMIIDSFRSWSSGVTNHAGLLLDDGTNPHGTTKSDVGLNQVDNTSDLNKPISTLTQSALDNKLDKDISTLPSVSLPLVDTDKVAVNRGGVDYSVNKSELASTELGKIRIVDKLGEVFTDLATANAYVSTFTLATLTDESFSDGVYHFTVPNGTSFAEVISFLGTASSVRSAYIEDNLGLINAFGNISFKRNSGDNILGNCTFGRQCFLTATGNNTLGNCTFDDSSFDFSSGINKFKNILLTDLTDKFARSSTGRFEIYGTIGTTTGNDYPDFFLTSNATIWADKSKETINAGGIEGDLARAQTNGSKLFFGYVPPLSTLPAVSLPLVDSDKLIVNRSGVDYSVDKSEFGGVTDDYFTYVNSGFSFKSTTVNTWLRNDTFIYYNLRYTTSAGTTNHSLLVPDVYSILLKIPQDCYLEDLTLRRPSNLNGKISIWKTTRNIGESEQLAVSSNPVEIVYEDIDTIFSAGGQMGSFNYGTSIPLLKDEYIHLFFSADSTSEWFNKLYIRFKKQ